MENVRSYNVGNSDYAEHDIQPWDVWIAYRLDAFRGDVVKRLLRKKKEKGMTARMSRKMDYEKIKHISLEMQRQELEGVKWARPVIKPSISVEDICRVYTELNEVERAILSQVLSEEPKWFVIEDYCNTLLERMNEEEK